MIGPDSRGCLHKFGHPGKLLPRPFPMLNISNRTAATAARAAHRIAPSKGMATVSSRIGDKKVAMSLLESDTYINYQRIDDNLAIVRERCAY